MSEKCSHIPLNGIFKITCEFMKRGNWKAGFHTGVDLVNEDGIIYSPTYGSVNNIGYDASYGNFIDIVEPDRSHHWLCHLSKINCNLGQEVTPTTPVGIMGSTGNSTGRHLHYEIRNESNHYGDVVDPCDYMMIPNEVGTYNEENYRYFDEVSLIAEMKTLAKNTNLRSEPTLYSKSKTLYKENTTLFIIEKNVCQQDGFIWDKVRIRVTGQIGYMINKNYK